MRIFVTGGTGFVGSRLIQKAIETFPNASIHVLVRKNSDTWRIQEVLSQVTLHEGDVTDAASLAHALQQAQPTHLFHFANAGVYGGISVSPAESFSINTMGLLTLLEAARPYAYEAFVNIGSSSEYGPKNVPMVETDICEPVSAYGVAKLAATHVAALEGTLYAKPIATFRLFSPYGPADDAQRLVSKAIASLLESTPFRTPHTKSVRDYLFVDDAVALLLEASQNLSLCRGEVFNVGSGVETRAMSVVEEIAQQTEREAFLAELPVSEESLSPTESPRWVANMEKTFGTFTTRPTTTLSEGLRKTIAFVRANPERYRA